MMLERHPGLILIAATNFYDGLDRALIREGRFDLHVRLDLPNEDERARIFEAQLAKRPSRHFDLQPFAKRTPGWSAAKIGTLVDRAAFFAAEEQRKIEERRPDASFCGHRREGSRLHSKRWTGRTSFCPLIPRQISGIWFG